MKIFKILSLGFVLFIGSIGLAGAGYLGPNGISWEQGANVGIEELLGSTFFGAYSEIGDYDFKGMYEYTAIAHESGHTNIVKGGVPWEFGGTMETTFTTADYDDWGHWETVDFDGVKNLKFRDETDGSPNVFVDPFDSTKWTGKYLKLFKLEDPSAELTWLDGNPVLSAGTIIAAWNDNHLRNGDSMDSDFDDMIVAMKPVPEPGTILLLGLGLMGVAGLGRRMKK